MRTPVEPRREGYERTGSKAGDTGVVAERATPAPRPGMPHALRAIVVLLLLDLFIGIWMRLHAERWLAFFLTHLPVLGLAGILWGFTPDESKQWLEQRMRRALESRWTWVASSVLVLALLAVGAVYTSVHVELEDPAVRTPVRLVRGERTRRDTAAVRTASAEPLNRLTSPVTFSVWLPPTGRRMWVYAGTLASASKRVMPLWPTRVRYPDDFDTLATLAVLPAPSMLLYTSDTAAPPTLTIREAGTAIELARAPLKGMRAVMIGFPEIASSDSAARALWREPLRAFFAGEAASETEVESTLAMWLGAHRETSSRPLILNEVLRWEVHLADGRLLKSDTTRVTRAISHVFLEP
jgi:hypothetical protein